MHDVSIRSLKILAALVWYIGGVVLVLKGLSLLIAANTLKQNQIWPWLAILIGLGIGGFKAKLLFSRFCRKNLERINTLTHPKLWQFFRLRFFLFLSAMILFSAVLTRLATHNYPFLIGIAMLDLSIAVALVGSGHIFLEKTKSNT